MHDLTFTRYNLDLDNEKSISILEIFKPADLGLYRQWKDSFQIVYWNRPLFVCIPSICGLLMRGEYFLRNLYSYYMPQPPAFFAEYNMMQLGCKERLTKDEIIYFEDLIVFFYKIFVNAVENLYYCHCKIVKAKAYLQ